MLTIKTDYEIELMRKAGAIVRDVLEIVGNNAKPGVTTRKLDAIAYDYIKKCGAHPSFLGYGGFPSSICTSIDEEIVHGIPSGRVLEEGCLLKIDAGACLNGFHADAARTFLIGNVSEEKRLLAKACEESFFRGISILKDGIRLGDLGNCIQTFVEGKGYSVVRELVGHGIGRELHEDPSVPNYGIMGRGLRLSKNMTIAIEPMINYGTRKVQILEDNWTVVTQDGKPSAHYENTVVIKEEGVEILTL
ncbi:MAG: Methionine aminopeptidase 1 [Firmicutes bacterium ADurb.Bin080]|jgi:methionyl aminopeptidase|nr:type I methionyl aminopeptidase [Clostridiales bacterium]OQC15612.1 MAG: Methionine aminopeptidase 1 [Firmicutes bacterium ADurb.Bin080]